MSKAVIAAAVDNDYWIVLSDSFPGTESWVRNAFEGLVEPGKIVTIALVTPTDGANPQNNWRRRAAEIIRHAAISQLKPDILFVPSALEGSWDNVVTFKEGDNFPVVVTAHDFIPFYDQKEHLKQPQDRYAYFRLLKNFLDSDGILAISDYVEKQCIWDLGVDPELVLNASEGVDGRFVPKEVGSDEKSAILNRYKITKKFILNTSPFEHRKNLEGMIEGFSRIPKRIRSAYQIVIIGKMDEYARTSLRNLTLACGLSEKDVILTGFVADKDLVSLYRLCFLFIFPSYSEGFGLPPLEAMACGAPTVGSSATSIPEVIGFPEALFDPHDRSDIARVITRAITDHKFYETLKQHALTQSARFSWEDAAKRALDFFGSVFARHNENTDRHLGSLATSKPQVLYVTYFSEYMDRLTAYNVSFLPVLSRTYNVSVVNLLGQQFHNYFATDTKVHDLEWLERNHDQFDLIIYALPENVPDRIASIIEQYPGVIWFHSNYGPTSHRCPLPSLNSNQFIKNCYAMTNLEGIASKTSSHRSLYLDGLLQNHAFASLADFTKNAKIQLLPRLGVRVDKIFEQSFRSMIGDTRSDIFCILVDSDDCESVVQNIIAELELNKVLSKRATDTVFVCARMRSKFSSEGTSFVRNYTNVYQINDLFGNFYAGIIASAAAVLYIKNTSSDSTSSDFAAYVVDDCRASGKQFNIIQANNFKNSILEILNRPLNEGVRADYPENRDIFDNSKVVLARLKSIIAGLHTTSPLYQYKMLIKSFPKRVEGVEPTPNDLMLVSNAIEKNEIILRKKTIFLDISGLLETRRKIGYDVIASRLIRNLSKNLSEVFDLKFIFHNYSDYFESIDIILPLFHCDVEAVHYNRLLVKNGDIVLGIDILNSFPTRGYQALQWLEQAGAEIVYFEGGSSVYDSVDRYVIQACKVIKNISKAKKDLRSIGAIDNSILDDIYDLKASKKKEQMDFWVNCLFSKIVFDTNGNDRKNSYDHNYVVMGHIRWIYSLAIINRAVARVLESENPGRVRFLAYETDRTDDINHMPSEELPLMKELVSRPEIVNKKNIYISQHYPILAPPEPGGLKCALFAWEETHVPQDTIDVLSTTFDVVLSPTSFVSNALINSGLRIPVITTGQPSNVDLFVQRGRVRHQHTKAAQTYLHVSSCFPRKGCDRLLTAWFSAFTGDDDVKLIIKTFPNIHNTVRADLEHLRHTHENCPNVEIIEDDLSQAELAELYDRSDVVVLPTRGEGYNLPALEAMLSGIPLIVTGFGGHIDFCGPEEARLISYSLSSSGSHVSNGSSMWAEPDIGDLISALRELQNPSMIQEVENRRLAALERASYHSDHIRWLRLFHGAIEGLLAKPIRPASPKILWVSTWNLRCGVATYSQKLIEHFSDEFTRNLNILCDYRTDENSPRNIEFSPSWDKGVDFNSQDLEARIVSDPSQVVVIQHQNGLIPWSGLLDLISSDAFYDKILIITLHNIRDLASCDEELISSISKKLRNIDRILVHNIDDVNYLISIGVTDNVCLFPHGTEKSSISLPLRDDFGHGDGPIIGSHGFFLPHKGIDKLIRIFPRILNRWSNARLRLVNAEFTDDKISKLEIAKCKKLAAELGVYGQIDWMTDFVSFDEINKKLSNCDLLVLPYDNTIESASGAVRTCMTSTIPVVTTDVNIFKELDEAAIRLKSDDDDCLFQTIESLIDSYATRVGQQEKIKNWLSVRQWEKVSDRLENIILTLIENNVIKT
ncbi:glycosyltransferase [Gluconobacter wancherniae]|uniref:glycosyltransferase n=1 Tax=Gluconobacter wancherniae TaxID=1307955 RepID=UPI001B8CC696|nr:glycosyltransferase [Gluconobacter wancherniae]MBS1095852.1 glycosyltransferase [Gluconobacter wancherniae]